MNLKGLKKVHEDDHVALFRSKDGHECRISKKGLSEKLRKELAALPVHAFGGTDTEKIMSSPDDQEEKSDFDKALDRYEQSGPNCNPTVEGEGARAAQEANNELIKDTVGNLGGGDNAWKRASEKEPARDTSQALSQGPMSVEPPVEEVPAVAKEVPQQPAPAAPQQVRRTPDQVYAESKQKRNMEASNIYNDLMAGHIKPQTYHQLLFEGKDFFGRMGSMFGLLLSGAGSGLAKQPNMLLEMMNKEIDRNLESQVKSVESAQNLYRLNIQKELADANMTKAQAETAGIWKDVQQKALQNSKTQMELFVFHSLGQQAHLLPSSVKPVANQTLNGLEGQVVQSIDKRNDEMAQNEALRMMGQLGYLPGADKIADSREARTVPGVGTSAQVVPGPVREQLAKYQGMNDALDDLMNYSKKHNNVLPVGPAFEEGATKALAVQQMVREVMLHTVFRDSEKKLLDQFVELNPAGVFKAIKTQPKLKAILESNRIASNALKKSYGLPTKGAESPTPPDGTPIKYEDGSTGYWQGGKRMLIKKQGN